MTNKIGKIYRHYSKTTNKSYIGSTTLNPQDRWRKNNKSYYSYRSCTKFYYALKKYTWDGFFSEILEDNVPLDKIAEREEYYIHKYDSFNNGYNTLNYSNGQVIPHNKKFYIEENNIKLKHCSKCNKYKELVDYNKQTSCWDGLSRVCRDCTVSSYSNEKRPRLTDIELKQSYIDRNQSMRQGVINAYKKDPSIKKRLSKSKSKPIKAVNITTGEILNFSSALDAKSKGFNNTNLGQAIKYNKPYKGYIWSFEQIDTNIKEIESNKVFLEDTKQETKKTIELEKIVVYARDCTIREITTAEEKTFLDRNHLQGYVYSRVKYGLEYKGELVFIMTFSAPRYNKNFEWEIMRLCTKKEMRVPGGASKIYAYFIAKNNPKNVISYCRKDFGNGDVYRHLGFSLIGKTDRSYHYEKDGKRYSRIKCQKHKLKTFLQKYDSNLTEYENMINNGFIRVNDSDNYIFKWVDPKKEKII